MAAPYMPFPAAMLLGGSRGGQAGQVPLSSSDHDVLLLAEWIRQPVSLTLESPYSGGKFDIILRDPETLAHDVEAARQGGNATLLHLCGYSQIIHDRDNLGGSLQQNARRLYQQGPHPITGESLREEIAESCKDLRELQDEPNHDVFAAAALSLTHRFGRLALRAARCWTANGKVVARFLDRDLPGLRDKLEAASHQMTPGNTGAMQDFVERELPRLYRGGEDGVPLHQVHSYPERPSVAEVYHYGRMSSIALCDYLAFGHSMYREAGVRPLAEAAQDWVRYMFNLTSSAVTPERYGRTNGEYRYALARHVGQLADMTCLARDYGPERYPLLDRLNLMAEDAPDVLAALPSALRGEPERLHQAAWPVLESVAPGFQDFQPRLSPVHLRRNAHEVGLV